MGRDFYQEGGLTLQGSYVHSSHIDVSHWSHVAPCSTPCWWLKWLLAGIELAGHVLLCWRHPKAGLGPFSSFACSQQLSPTGGACVQRTQAHASVRYEDKEYTPGTVQLTAAPAPESAALLDVHEYSAITAHVCRKSKLTPVRERGQGVLAKS